MKMPRATKPYWRPTNGPQMQQALYRVVTCARSWRFCQDPEEKKRFEVELVVCVDELERLFPEEVRGKLKD